LTGSAPSLPARQVRAFVAGIDLLAERLTPSRRPQDLNAPECSHAELRILSALARAEPVTMSDLAAWLHIPLSTASRAVDKLVAKQLVERRGIRNDRRVVQVAFSPLGKEINRFVLRSRLALARRILASLAPSERNALLACLSKLTSAR